MTAVRVRFALSFAILALVLFSIYTFPYEENGIPENWFASYLSWYARLAGSVLGFFEPTVTVNGPDIVGRSALKIVKSCDAMEALILFSAAVLSFPVAWRRRMLGILIGVPALIAVNVLRICNLYYIGVYRPSAFEFFHIEVWPLILVSVSVMTFLFWAVWANRSQPGEARAAA